MFHDNKVAVIILAAGKSTRMDHHINKQYIMLGGFPVLAHTIMKFNNNSYIDEIILVVNSDDIIYCEEEIVKKYSISKVVRIVPGGKERQESCRNGILNMSYDTEYVLMHDGARPFLTDGMIEDSLYGIKEAGVICTAVPVKDTVKMTDGNNNIIDTPDRSLLYAAQTPQGFRYNIINQVYNKAAEEDFKATDDVQIAEKYGYKPKIVRGSYENIKITTKEDLYLAELILNNREN